MGIVRRFGKLAVALAVALAAAVGSASGAGARIAATTASFSPIADGTRFVLEVSDEPTYRLFVVDGPPRLVVDLDDVVFDIVDPAEASGHVRAWRFGALSPTSGRIVFDLAGPVLVARRFFLPPLAGRPARLVLDLAAASAEDFGAATRLATAERGADGTTAARAPGPVVVIDPGHGGIDPGAVTSDGLQEKTIALAFAQRLREKLEAMPGLTVRLTRSDDRFLSLNRRIRIARAYGADLFLSIHADAAPEDYVRGASVYTLSERPSDAQAAALAARENLADEVSGVIEPQLQEEVSGILADLLRRETKSYSFSFAETLVARLRESVDINNNAHRHARFRVLMAHDVPSVLLELGFLTNEEDVGALTDEEWHERASTAVAAAVQRFFSAQIVQAAPSPVAR